MENQREYFIIDRIESSRIVLQSLSNGETFSVERDIFGDEPKEGNAVYLEEGYFITDQSYTVERKKNLTMDMNRLFNRKKK